MTPMCFVRLAAHAVRAPGSTAPRMGCVNAAWSAPSANADAVLHAMRTIFTPRSTRNLVHASEYLTTVSGLFDPYGNLAVSPR
jgi:hypothetical protein